MEWVVKTYAKVDNSVPCDVVITSVADREKRFTAIRFRRNSHKKITKNRHVIFAVDGTRLYFAEAEPIKGWKLSESGKYDKSVYYFKIDNKRLPIDKVEQGCYNLELDEDRMLWFIDVTHKIKPGLQWNGKRSFR